MAIVGRLATDLTSGMVDMVWSVMGDHRPHHWNGGVQLLEVTGDLRDTVLSNS